MEPSMKLIKADSMHYALCIMHYGVIFWSGEVREKEKVRLERILGGE
jgi:hypothetical protein